MTLDTVLTAVGLILISFGLYIFLTGKGRGEGAPSNRVEGFGIKVDVANPSILLILLGVGLVLVPRFFPGPLPGDIAAIKGTQDDKPSQPAQSSLAQMPAVDQPPAPLTPPPIVLGDEPADVKPAEKEPAAKPAPAPVPVSVSTPAPAPASRADAQGAKQVPAVNTAATAIEPIPEAKAKPKPAPKVLTPAKPVSPVAQAKEIVVAKAKPTPPPEPTRPDLWVVVDAEVAERAGMRGITAQEYSQALRERLAKAASQRFGSERVTIAGKQPQVRGSDYAQVCADSPADKVLLATLRVPPWGVSTIESAFWPDLVMAGVDCRDGQVQPSESKRLTPGFNDSVFFENDFLRAAKSFIIGQSYFFEAD